MAKRKTATTYEEEIIKMIKDRNGVFDEWLRPQVEGAAMNRVLLAQIHEEITQAANLTIIVDGSMGQKKKEAHPLLAVYDKMQRTLLLQYEALGLNYKTTPSKVSESTKKQPQEDDPFIRVLQATKEAASTDYME